MSAIPRKLTQLEKITIADKTDYLYIVANGRSKRIEMASLSQHILEELGIVEDPVTKERYLDMGNFD